MYARRKVTEEHLVCSVWLLYILIILTFSLFDDVQSNLVNFKSFVIEILFRIISSPIYREVDIKT